MVMAAATDLAAWTTIIKEPGSHITKVISFCLENFIISRSELSVVSAWRSSVVLDSVSMTGQAGCMFSLLWRSSLSLCLSWKLQEAFMQPCCYHFSIIMNASRLSIMNLYVLPWLSHIFLEHVMV